MLPGAVIVRSRGRPARGPRRPWAVGSAPLRRREPVSPRLLAILLLVGSVLATIPAVAAPVCGPGLNELLARCARDQGVPMKPRACSPRVVVEVGDAPFALSVELRDGEAFRTAGGVGLQPRGEFADWSAEPEPLRRNLDALEACFASAPPPPTAQRPPPPPPARVPYLLLAGALAVVALLRSRGPTAIVGGAITYCAAWLVRSAVVQPEFFHQNGQGPIWVAAAAGRDGQWPYGPGYAELFGWLAESPDGDLHVFRAVTVLGAMAAPFAVGIARHAGARWPSAFALGALVAIDPVLARVSSSESYFGVIVALLFAATWLVGEGMRRTRGVRYLAFVGAGLLVAQAARIHPTAWIPCATVALAAAFAPFRRERARAVSFLSAALVVGLVATPFVLGPLREVLAGEIGQWRGAAQLVATRWSYVALAVALAGLLLARGDVRRGVVAAALVVVAADVTCVVRNDSAVVAHAHFRTFLPAFVAALGYLASALPPRAVPLALAPLAVLVPVSLGPVRRLPTDAVEHALLRTERAKLPRTARVCFVARAERRVMGLPLFDKKNGPVAIPIDEPGFTSGCTHYVRTSLCASPEGRGACIDAERALPLRLLAERTLPAVQSLPWLPYDVPTITVSLHEVVRPAP